MSTRTLTRTPADPRAAHIAEKMASLQPAQQATAQHFLGLGYAADFAFRMAVKTDDDRARYWRERRV